MISSFKLIFIECLLWARHFIGDLKCTDEQEKVPSLPSSQPEKGSKMQIDSVI